MEIILNIIWIEPNINSEENINYSKEIESLPCSKVKICKTIEEAIIYLKSISFEETKIIVNGELYIKFIRKLYENIKEIYAIPKIIIFTKNKEKFLKDNKNYENIVNHTFYNLGGIKTNFEEILQFLKESIIRKKDEPQLTFEYIDNKDKLLLPILYKCLIDSVEIDKIDKYNDFLYNKYTKNNDDLKKLLLQIKSIINIPIEFLSKYYVRAYTADSDFYKDINKDLRENKREDYLSFIKILYEGIKLRSFPLASNKILFRGSVISREEIKLIKNYLKKRIDNLPGAIVYSRSFLSFSKEKGIAENFLTYYNINNNLPKVLYILENDDSIDYSLSTHGDIEKISFIPEEKEVLFFPFSSFEIKDIKEVNIRGEFRYEIKLLYLGKYFQEIEKDRKDDDKKDHDIPDSEFKKKIIEFGLIKKENIKSVKDLFDKFKEYKKFSNNNNMYNIDEPKSEACTEKNNDKISFQNKSTNITGLLLLQFLISKIKEKKILKVFDIIDKMFPNNKKDFEIFYSKIDKCNYITVSSLRYDIKDYEILNISSEYDKRKILENIYNISANKNYDDINMLELSRNILYKELDDYFIRLGKKQVEYEINPDTIKIITDLYEFNKVFDNDIEVALKNSIFEYKLAHLFIVDKNSENYIKDKMNCNHRKEKILFHGTSTEIIMHILSSHFLEAKAHRIGPGIYFTDSLDYNYYFSGNNANFRRNIGKIPSVGESFSFIGSEIYYDQSKIEYVYNYEKRDYPVQQNGIRVCFIGFNTRIMKNNELKINKENYFKELVITDKSQILPLYGITLKRIEYLVIWRDFNFNLNNPNHYDINKFEKIKEFHNNIKRIISREYDSNVYYLDTNEEALELIKRKKYNKIIIITNGNNDGQKFIIDSRKIIGANTIAAVSTFNINSKVEWVKKMKNVLLLNGINFHERFFKCIKELYIKELIKLREDIVNEYSNIPSFKLKEFDNDLFNFVNFKDSGKFSDLKF